MELIFSDNLSLKDLNSFVARGRKLEADAIRLQAAGSVLAATIATLAPQGLLERGMPTVLGMRIFGIEQVEQQVDKVVELRALQDTLAHTLKQEVSASLHIPPVETSVIWSGVTPPRSGWQKLPELDAAMLRSVAKVGIDQISAVLPATAGEPVLRKVRAQIWGEVISETNIPAGAAFALDALGFLHEQKLVSHYQHGNWHRLTTPYGHVLTR